ncbi:MFS transporter [Acuticoccus sp. MNP-M23]|uniref:MFS transporter n=1 Tax=Acuticoccus sp. MNP-M23 TaxID=3072793 RepID=UPI002814F739|nr:MFS transporter [Acuticoccus sp. MNP-M23]WMS41673.1 MFS transporter [Acuticoccus sp. MNP-M23]
MTPPALGAAAPVPRSYRATFQAAPGLPLIMATVAAHMMMFGMLTPVMAIYASDFGVAEWAIGLMITVFAAGRLLADIPAGHASQRFGLSTMLWLGPAIAGSASLLGAFAVSYEMLLAGRALQGVGSGIYMTAATVYCASVGDRHVRGRIMALFQGALLAGAAMGPVTGGIVADLFGLSGPFLASAAVGGVTAILVAVTIHPPEIGKKGGHHGPSGKLLALLLIAPFACVLLINFGIFMTRTAGQWQMIPLLATERFAMSPGDIGLAITVSALANLAVLPIAGTIVDTLPRPLVIVLSTLAAAASVAVIALSGSELAFWLAMAAMGVSTGLGGPAVAAFAVDVAPEEMIGPAMGVMRFAGDFGYLLGPLSLGALVDLALVTHAGALLVNAVLLAVFAVVFSIFVAIRPAKPAGGSS